MENEEVAFNNCAAQGDLMIRRIDKIPEGCTKSKVEDGVYIVAHSETGHHHVIPASGGVCVLDRADKPGVKYLQTDTTTRVKHERSFDTHKTIVVPPGLYELRRQREATPEGWAFVAD